MEPPRRLQMYSARAMEHHDLNSDSGDSAENFGRHRLVDPLFMISAGYQDSEPLSNVASAGQFNLLEQMRINTGIGCSGGKSGAFTMSFA